MLRLGMTLKGLTEAGFQSGWLTLQCHGWELAHEGGGMNHMVLRSKVRQSQASKQGASGFLLSGAGRTISNVYYRDIK